MPILPLIMGGSKKNILVTGGTGFIGRYLTAALLEKGHEVSLLSRKPGKDPRIKTYLWDVNKGYIDEHCLDGIDLIIHLAGAGIADEKWTEARKKELIDSRTNSIGLIYQLIKTKPNSVKRIISASAIGYYGSRADEILTESSQPGKDGFMPECCIAWENAIDEGKALGLSIIKFRTGVVLDKSSGALPQMALPVKLFAGAPLGAGDQWIPWIHWNDALDMYLFALEHEDMQGVYNMVAPNPVTNKQLTKAIAKQLHRPVWPVGVPKFLLNLILGEMSVIVLGSTRVSASAIEAAGFVFKYPGLTDALASIYK